MAVTSYPVTWSDEAKKNKDDIHRYLAEAWSEKEIRQFYRVLDQRISLIARHPKMSPKTEKRQDVRRSVLTKQISLYYKFDGRQVEILFLFDNRQDPENRPI